MNYYYKTIASPVGKLRLIASDRGLAAVLWIRKRPHPMELEATAEANDHPILLQAAQQLAEYFAGQRDTFPIALDLRGSEFQLSAGKRYKQFRTVKHEPMVMLLNWSVIRNRYAR